MLAYDIKTTQTRFGEMAYFAGDHYIGRSLELYGEYSWGEIELLAKFVKPGWVIVNGGANIGALTVPLAKLCDSHVKVYAFEPQPEVCELLMRNCETLPNVFVSSDALWASCGESKMRLLHEIDTANIGSLIINDSKGSHKVKTVSLDHWLGGEKVDLVFLDIEGCETGALRGAKETIEKHRPILYVEDHPEYNSDVTPYVQSLDYFTYAHAPLLFSPTNWKGYPESFFGNVASFNTLAIPKERIEEFRTQIDELQEQFFLKQGSQNVRMIPRRQVVKKWAGIVRCGGVGDNLIAASPCRALKEMGYQVEMITQRPQGVVFENNPYIDKISVHDSSDWPVELGDYLNHFRIRAKGYDRFANLSHTVEARHGLVPIQSWYWLPVEYRRKLCAGNYLETAHDVLGVPHTFGPLFFPTDEEKEQAETMKRKLEGDGPLIAWTLSGTRVDKVYPYAALLISRLIKELGARVVMLGGPPPYRDIELARGIESHVRVQNGTTDGLFHAASPSMDNQTWPIRRILTFAAQSDLVIGPDTGPSWAVAFEPVPKIILISHTSAENITKHWINTATIHADAQKVPCWPCHRLHDSFDTCNPVETPGGKFAKCMSDIEVEAIITIAARILNRRP